MYNNRNTKLKMVTDKGIEKMIELHNEFLLNPDRKVSKKIDLVVYIGETVSYLNDFLGKRQRWPEKIIKALKIVDTNFYKEFSLGFNYEFKEWRDNSELWMSYLNKYDELGKKEKSAFKKMDKEIIKIAVQEYKKSDYFNKCFFNLAIQHVVVNQESHSKKIILGITGHSDIKYNDPLFPNIRLGKSLEITERNPVIPKDNNYGYVIVSYGYKQRSPSKLSTTIQHEISHLFGAEHCKGRSVMNKYRGRCKRWDNENKEIIKEYIKNL